MRSYRKITIWENERRLAKLHEFINLLNDYYNDIRYDSYGGGDPIEGEAARSARTLINRTLDEVYEIIWAAHISSKIFYSPPRATGGIQGNIDLLTNIFNLHTFRLSPDGIYDIIDRVIGIYQTDKGKATFRTFNPLFYIGLIISWIAELPFIVIGRLGFNRGKIEGSFLGRITKGTLEFATLLTTVSGLLITFGYFEPVKSFIRSVVDKFLV